MNRTSYAIGRRPAHVLRVRDLLPLAALLAFGVVAWQHFIHADLLGHSDTLTGHVTHALRDAVLAFGPALLAVAGGLWLARRLGVAGHAWPHVLGRAAIVSITFILFMMPSVGVHGMMDSVLEGGDAAIAEGEAVHSHGGSLESTTGLLGLALHGGRDALVGQAIALPLLVVGLALPALARRGRALGPRAATVRRRATHRRRWAFALAPAGVAAVVLPVLAVGSLGFGSSAQAQPLGPCSATAPLRHYDVTAIDVDITLNRFGDHDPMGKMYVLNQDIGAVRAQEASGEVSLGLRTDPIQPLAIRANMGDCLEITFTNLASGGDYGIHIDGLVFDVESSGDAIGNNPSSAVPFGGTRTYRWFVPNEPALEGARYMHPGPGNRLQAVSHGLFGALMIEPPGSTYLHPETGLPLDSGWEAMIVPAADAAFREFVTFWHEVGDETFAIGAGDGGTLPQVDPETESYRPAGRAINYRSEPFMHLMKEAPDQTAQSYGSYTFGDPPTPIPRAYLGDPTKMRIIHGGSEVLHVFHLHGGGIRWRQNPHADPTWDYADTGLVKTQPEAELSPSMRLDSQTLGPGESFDLQIGGGAGGRQKAVGDFLYHCHIAEHYVSGMWSFWRVFDTVQPDLAPLPDRQPVPTAVDSAGLIGLTMPDGTTLTADNLDEWIRPLLAPQGVSQGRQDASVWDWVIDDSNPAAPIYLGEVADPGPFPNLPNVVPGHPGSFPSDELVETPEGFRPKLKFNPSNGRPAYPILRPHIGKRPPFSPNGHSGAPWLGETGDQPPSGAGVDPWANRPDGICIAGAPVKRFNIVAIELPIQVTAKGETDRTGKIFVLAQDVADVLAGRKPAEPLAIRGNVGDCMAHTLTSELTDEGAHDEFSKVNIHPHFIQFDVQGSDGVITGLNFETSVRPFRLEDPTLTQPVTAGDMVLALSSVSKFQPGVWIGIGLGTEGIEVRQIESIDAAARTVTLTKPVGAGHGAGEFAGVEFVQYRWFVDVALDNIFFHDHVDTIRTVPQGLVGQFLVEPRGSTYHDPVTGEEVRSGNIVDIHTTNPLAPGVVDGSFREFVIHPIDGNVAAGSTFNLRAEPWKDRDDDPSLIFSSFANGDPFTPMPRAYPSDPFVIRIVNSGPRSDPLYLDGHRFTLEPRFRGAGGEPLAAIRDTVSVGISERYNLMLEGGAGGIRQEPGDYLYASTHGRRFRDGAWGIIRVLPCGTGDLQPLPGRPAPDCDEGLPERTCGRPPVVLDAGDFCSPDARQVSIDISAVDVKDKRDGVEAAFVLSADAAAVKDGDMDPDVLVAHFAAGDCITVHFTNERDNDRASLHVGRLRTVLSSGINIGFGPEQTVAPGQSRDYRFFADSALGAIPVADFGGEDTGIDGLYGAFVIHEAGATFTDPVSGEPAMTGAQVDVHLPGTPGYRDFTLIFSEDDPQIGGDFMPYPEQVEQPALVNYRTEPRRDDTGDAFSSLVHGDPETPILRAYVGDPTRVHVMVAPGSEQMHVFNLGGLTWPEEPRIPNSNLRTARHFGAFSTFDLEVVGGAGGLGGIVGDFFYGDLRRPFTQGGMWGLLRVLSDPACPIMPLDGRTCEGGSASGANPGLLRVTTSPAVPTQISIDGTARDAWGLTWLKLDPGTYEVSFSDVEVFTTPDAQTVTVTDEATTELAGVFPQRGSLRVVTSPAVPGTISVDGVPRNDWGMWTDLPPGTYDICFGGVPGFLAPACQVATVAAGNLAEVTGVYVP